MHLRRQRCPDRAALGQYREQRTVNTSQVFGLAASIVTLAMLSVAIYNGDKTAKVVKAFGDTFAGSIKAATGRAL